ncbi:hypothetical protein CAPTEDRAFT_183585 [Capitella teleta]|uniref:Uncharacterized protein n=1 Tax=Capitella teleta TaxID=283909 RepID=R7UUQ6_CAPTE|nr:hypothetical protein CAPTEDRAFT_183585 [Capitella teleta]|eukprot:ELU10373.1 hypothetical protein CAPTEDRAFT_183585 [Capitella teleta]
MAETAESKRLLSSGSNGGSSGYGAEEDTDGPPPPYEETAPPQEQSPPPPPGKGRPWWKPRRGDRKLQRNSSLDKVDEDLEKEKSEQRCTDYFGVRSYLHDFYDTHVYKDPAVYEEEDDFRYLLNPRLGRGRRCTSIWWKVFVWIGANFLIFGIIGVLVGYLVPQRPIFAGAYDNNLEILDNQAIAFNFNLDVCKLVGLILFCIGGLTLAAALLFPSFLYHYCEDDRKEDSIRIHVGEKDPLKSPVEMVVPTCSTVTEVQPVRKNLESVVTREGMVPLEE